MTTTLRVACVLLCSMVVIGPATARALDGVEAKAAFDRLKALAGEWKVTGETTHADSKVIYQVTAAGCTLMESQFPGSGHEMVTMYHLDGKELRVTHDCAAGNQPRLKLDLQGSTPDRLSFVFEGGTNLDPAKDTHIHGLRVKFLEGGTFEEEWDGYTDGKMAGTTRLTMNRR